MDLEQRLAAAKARLDAALKAMAPKHRGGEWEELHAAQAELLAVEREVAAAKHEQYLITLDVPRWNAGAPMPQLLVNDHRAFLLYLVHVPDPKWDGSYATVKSSASHRPESLASVELTRCVSAKLGSPNDEVLEGHPLAGRGLEPYRAQRVINSQWVAELQKVNSVHRRYDPAVWQQRHHYIFWFHDTTFECVAEGFEVELHDCSMPELLAETCRRLVR